MDVGCMNIFTDLQQNGLELFISDNVKDDKDMNNTQQNVDLSGEIVLLNSQNLPCTWIVSLYPNKKIHNSSDYTT